MIQSHQPHLLILGPLDFPGATAPSSRVRAYGRGIIENGGKVTVLSYRPCHSKSDVPAEGVVDGIHYIYACGRTLRPKSFLMKLVYEIIGVFNAFRMIRKIHRSDPVDAILFYAIHTTLGGYFALWAHRLRIPILEEKCEFQFRERKHFYNALRARIYEKWAVPQFDGMVIMTDALESYYRPLMRDDARVLRMPILVDMTRFEGPFPQPVGRTVVYCGAPSGDKDGIPILLEAFALIADHYPDVRLVIVGSYKSQAEKESILRRMRDLGISDKVEVTGRKRPEEVPMYLCGAAALVLARPDNLQAKYGFPTKLGEYLSTGKPVVVTRVGEIGNFLKDGYSAYIAEPGSAESFAQKLDEALSDPNCPAIGAAGKEVARQHFAYHEQGKRFSQFIISLKDID